MVETTMEWIQDRNNRIPFSLHDSRIKKITIQNNTLTLKLDKVFQYTKDKETIYSGDLIFNDSDLDECSVFILDRIVYEGDFSGKAISLKEYMNQFSNLEFEILTEGYFGYSTTYTGWIWEEGKNPVSGMMYIRNTGDIIYCLEP